MNPYERCIQKWDIGGVKRNKPVEPIIPVFDKDDLPSQWKLVPIGEICLPVKKVNPKEDHDVEFKYIDISGIDNEQFRITETKRYTGRDAPSRARQLVQTGDILFSTVRTYLKNIARVTSDLDGQIASTGFCVLRPAEPEYREYLYYYVQYDPFLNELAKFQRGTSYPAVRDGDIFAQFIPIPPKWEVTRIVAEIEKQFSRLDEAVANLKRVRANLKRYKAAVLKTAVEGKLTEQWRKEHPDVERGSELLERILAQRHPKGKDEGGRDKYLETGTHDIRRLIPLPKGWCWASVDQIIEESMIGLDRGRKHQSDVADWGVPYIKMNNVTMDGKVLYDEMTYVPASDEERRRYAIRDNDLLFNTRNSKELVGKVGLVRNPPKGAIYNNNLMRIRVTAGVIGPFICLQMCSDSFRRRMELVKKATTNVAAIYAKDLLPLQIVLPPTAEQQHIVAEVERRLSVVEGLEKEIRENLQRAERLRQSILGFAFSGKLVQQNTDAEPGAWPDLPLAAEAQSIYKSKM